MIFDEGEEGGRSKQAMSGATPADQGFGTDDRAGAHVNLGLVIEFEFAVLERLTDDLLVFVVMPQAVILFGIKKVEGIFAAEFGPVHRLVGLPQQLLVVHFPGLRVKGNAETGRNPQLRSVDVDGLVCRAKEALDRWHDGRGFGKSGQNDNEFIAANPGQRVAFPHGFLDAGGKSQERFVADDFAVFVVDCLEIVEVDVDDRDQLTAPVGCGHRLVHPVGQEGAIRQSGQGVVMRHDFDLALLFFHDAEVGKHRDVMTDLAAAVAYRADREKFGVDHAVLAAVPDFSRPATERFERFPQLLVKIPTVFA